MKQIKGWLVVALILVLLGAFTVSATSTWKLGERHHLSGLALPALIMMLEVGSVTAAAIYVATKRRALKWRAGVLIFIVSGVGATGGVEAYGFLIGIPVSFLLLFLVDLIGMYFEELRDDEKKPEVEPPPVVQPKPRTTHRRTKPAAPIEPATVPDQPAVVPEDQTEPVPSEPTRSMSAREIIADMKQKGETGVNQRFIRNTYGVGAQKANTVLEGLNAEPQAS